MKKIISILLVAVMMTSFVACGQKANNPSDTTDKETNDTTDTTDVTDGNLYSTIVAENEYFQMNAAEAAYLLYSNYSSYMSQMYNLLEIMGLKYDPSKTLHEQYYDEQNGVTWFDYFVSISIDNIKETMIVASLAKANGFEIDEEGRNSIEQYRESLMEQAKTNGYSSLDEYINDKLCKGVGFDAIEKMIEMQLYASAYYNDYTTKLKDGYTDEDYDKYIKENPDSVKDISHEYTRNVRHILFMTTTYGSSEKAMEKANEVYEEWKKNGSSLDEFIKIAKEQSDDTGSKESGGLYENVYEGQMVAQFEQWLFDDARKPGDTGVVLSSIGAHIMYYVGESDKKSAPFIVQKSMVSADYKKHVEENKAYEPKVFEDRFSVIP